MHAAGAAVLDGGRAGLGRALAPGRRVRAHSWHHGRQVRRAAAQRARRAPGGASAAAGSRLHAACRALPPLTPALRPHPSLPARSVLFNFLGERARLAAGAEECGRGRRRSAAPATRPARRAATARPAARPPTRSIPSPNRRPRLLQCAVGQGPGEVHRDAGQVAGRHLPGRARLRAAVRTVGAPRGAGRCPRAAAGPRALPRLPPPHTTRAAEQAWECQSPTPPPMPLPCLPTLQPCSDYAQSKLALEWRQWQTERMTAEYFSDRTFYQVQARPSFPAACCVAGAVGRCGERWRAPRGWRPCLPTPLSRRSRRGAPGRSLRLSRRGRAPWWAAPTSASPRTRGPPLRPATHPPARVCPRGTAGGRPGGQPRPAHRGGRPCVHRHRAHLLGRHAQRAHRPGLVLW